MTLNFNAHFVEAVANGTKPHTIRRGFNWREGMSIQFYQNGRQDPKEKIRPDDQVRVVQIVSITPTGSGRDWMMKVDGRPLTPFESLQLCQRDGFESFADLVEFLDNLYGLPFHGQLVGWTDLRY